jgi:hypothetical protein
MRTDWDAIEFTKTRGWEGRDRGDDDLDDYHGLVAWCEGRGLLSATQAREFRRLAGERPEQARSALEDARSLRALGYDVLRGVGRGRPPSGTDLRSVTDWVHRFSAARRLARSLAGIQWTWKLDPYRLDHPLAPVAWSIGELLTAPELARVRVRRIDVRQPRQGPPVPGAPGAREVTARQVRVRENHCNALALRKALHYSRQRRRAPGVALISPMRPFAHSFSSLSW